MRSVPGSTQTRHFAEAFKTAHAKKTQEIELRKGRYIRCSRKPGDLKQDEQKHLHATVMLSPQSALMQDSEERKNIWTPQTKQRLPLNSLAESVSLCDMTCGEGVYVHSPHPLPGHCSLIKIQLCQSPLSMEPTQISLKLLCYNLHLIDSLIEGLYH